MPIIGNHNLLSMQAQRHLSRTLTEVSRRAERLASGSRLVHTGDDPAGVMAAARFRAQAASQVEAQRNASHVIDLLKTADGGITNITVNLVRMRALAVQASNDGLTEMERDILQVEFDQLRSEVDRIGRTTNYNGLHPLVTPPVETTEEPAEEPDNYLPPTGGLQDVTV